MNKATGEGHPPALYIEDDLLFELSASEIGNEGLDGRHQIRHILSSHNNEIENDIEPKQFGKSINSARESRNQGFQNKEMMGNLMMQENIPGGIKQATGCYRGVAVEAKMKLYESHPQQGTGVATRTKSSQQHHHITYNPKAVNPAPNPNNPNNPNNPDKHPLSPQNPNSQVTTSNLPASPHTHMKLTFPSPTPKIMGPPKSYLKAIALKRGVKIFNYVKQDPHSCLFCKGEYLPDEGEKDIFGNTKNSFTSKSISNASSTHPIPQEAPETQVIVKHPTPLFSLTFHLLHTKYMTSRDLYNVKIVNDIIYNENTHIVSVFKDFLIYDDVSEFLKRFYNVNEAVNRLPKIFDFYDKYSKVFPNYVILGENKYMFKNIERKQRLIDDDQHNKKSKKQIKVEDESNNKIFTTGFMNNLSQTRTRILGNGVGAQIAITNPALERKINSPPLHPEDQIPRTVANKRLNQRIMRPPSEGSGAASSHYSKGSGRRVQNQTPKVEDLELDELVDCFIDKDSQSLIDVNVCLNDFTDRIAIQGGGQLKATMGSGGGMVNMPGLANIAGLLANNQHPHNYARDARGSPESCPLEGINMKGRRVSPRGSQGVLIPQNQVISVVSGNTPQTASKGSGSSKDLKFKYFHSRSKTDHLQSNINSPPTQEMRKSSAHMTPQGGKGEPSSRLRRQQQATHTKNKASNSKGKSGRVSSEKVGGGVSGGSSIGIGGTGTLGNASSRRGEHKLVIDKYIPTINQVNKLLKGSASNSASQKVTVTPRGNNNAFQSNPSTKMERIGSTGTEPASHTPTPSLGGNAKSGITSSVPGTATKIRKGREEFISTQPFISPEGRSRSNGKEGKPHLLSTQMSSTVTATPTAVGKVGTPNKVGNVRKRSSGVGSVGVKNGRETPGRGIGGITTQTTGIGSSSSGSASKRYSVHPQTSRCTPDLHRGGVSSGGCTQPSHVSQGHSSPPVPSGKGGKQIPRVKEESRNIRLTKGGKGEQYKSKEINDQGVSSRTQMSGKSGNKQKTEGQPKMEIGGQGYDTILGFRGTTDIEGNPHPHCKPSHTHTQSVHTYIPNSQLSGQGSPNPLSLEKKRMASNPSTTKASSGRSTECPSALGSKNQSLAFQNFDTKNIKSGINVNTLNLNTPSNPSSHSSVHNSGGNSNKPGVKTLAIDIESINRELEKLKMQEAGLNSIRTLTRGVYKDPSGATSPNSLRQNVNSLAAAAQKTKIISKGKGRGGGKGDMTHGQGQGNTQGHTQVQGHTHTHTQNIQTTPTQKRGVGHITHGRGSSNGGQRKESNKCPSQESKKMYYSKSVGTLGVDKVKMSEGHANVIPNISTRESPLTRNPKSDGLKYNTNTGSNKGLGIGTSGTMKTSTMSGRGGKTGGFYGGGGAHSGGAGHGTHGAHGVHGAHPHIHTHTHAKHPSVGNTQQLSGTPGGGKYYQQFIHPALKK